MKGWMLSDVQKKAVTTTEGALLVFAGAGSGKTRVITYRIAYLIREKNVPPEHILAVTFTNKAAKEMKERVASLIGDPSIVKRLTISTFHSLGLQILKREHKTIGYPKNFVLFTPYEQTELLKKVMEEMNISTERFSPRGMLSMVGSMKNNPEKNGLKASLANIRMSIAKRVYPNYNDALRAAGAMDFDDLILKTTELFKNDESIRQKYASAYKYIMVDEYQDTNQVQYEMVRNLASVHRNICAVGDDDQSIYSWRGAKVENILNFHKDFENCTVVKLEQNYRSVDAVVNAASRLINFNSTRAEKKVFTENRAEPGEGIKLTTHLDETEEAAAVAKTISEMHMQGKSYGDMAILVRANYQTRPFEIELGRNHIPYTIVGGQKFFENKEIKDLVAYLRILVNPNDEISLRRIINYPTRGIGVTTQEKLLEIAKTEKTSPFDVLETVEKYTNFKPSQIEALMNFRKLCKGMRDKLLTEDPVEMAKILVDRTGILADNLRTAKNDTIAKIKKENIDEFVNAVSSHKKERGIDNHLEFYADFINSMSLIPTTDEEAKENSVSVITAHSAKGLEFDTVFIIGFYMGGFPNQMAIDEGNIEEERRLCYVAITRAKRNLYISVPQSVRKMGKTEITKPSIFLNEAGISKQTAKASTMPQTDNVADLLGKMLEKISK